MFARSTNVSMMIAWSQKQSEAAFRCMKPNFAQLLFLLMMTWGYKVVNVNYQLKVIQVHLNYFIKKVRSMLSLGKNCCMGGSES